MFDAQPSSIAYFTLLQAQISASSIEALCLRLRLHFFCLFLAFCFLKALLGVVGNYDHALRPCACTWCLSLESHFVAFEFAPYNDKARIDGNNVSRE